MGKWQKYKVIKNKPCALEFPKSHSKTGSRWAPLGEDLCCHVWQTCHRTQSHTEVNCDSRWQPAEAAVMRTKYHDPSVKKFNYLHHLQYDSANTTGKTKTKWLMKWYFVSSQGFATHSEGKPVCFIFETRNQLLKLVVTYIYTCNCFQWQRVKSIWY